MIIKPIDQHTMDMLKEVYGYDPEEIAKEERNNRTLERIKAIGEDIDILNPEEVFDLLTMFYMKVMETPRLFAELRPTIKYLHWILSLHGYEEEVIKSIIFE